MRVPAEAAARNKGPATSCSTRRWSYRSQDRWFETERSSLTCLTLLPDFRDALSLIRLCLITASCICRSLRHEPYSPSTYPDILCMYASMYVRTDACTYICMHACIHAVMYLSVYVSMRMHVSLACVCVCVCIYIYIYYIRVCVHIYMHTYVHTFLCMYICMYIYIYIYIYTQAYSHYICTCAHIHACILLNIMVHTGLGLDTWTSACKPAGEHMQDARA